MTPRFEQRQSPRGRRDGGFSKSVQDPEDAPEAKPFEDNNAALHPVFTQNWEVRYYSEIPHQEYRQCSGVVVDNPMPLWCPRASPAPAVGLNRPGQAIRLHQRPPGNRITERPVVA